MQMLRNLLEKLNRVWYDKSRILPGITLRKGTGTHKLVTVQGGSLYFHSLPFSKQLTQLQEVVLDELTVSELIAIITPMGYSVTLENASILEESALIILEADNRSLLDNGETFYVFTSNIWRVMYPLHRKLNEAGRDVDMAVEQIMLPSASGEWLDYWVGFFKMKRLPDETDELLLRRAFLTISSVKANDIAIEELISYYIETNVKVLDYAPATFEIRVSPDNMAPTQAQKVHDLVKTLKGAGVAYLLNYFQLFEESYPNAFRSTQGVTFKDSNASFRSATGNLGRMEESYSVIPPSQATSGFVLNTGRLNSTKKLSVSDKRIVATIRMQLTQDGTIIQEM